VTEVASKLVASGFRRAAGAALLAVLCALATVAAASGTRATRTAAYVPAAGTSVPAAHVNFSMAPFANDGIPVIGMLQGYFKDVGITIGPTKTGANLILNQSLAPLLNGQVDAGSAVFEVMLQQLDNVNNIRAFAVVDTYVGQGIFAPPGSSAKSVADYMKSGLSFDQALAKTLAELKDANVVLPNDANQAFWNYILEKGGLSPSSVTRLDNPTILNQILAKQVDFGGLAGGPQYLKALTEGSKLIVSLKDLLSYSKDPDVGQFVNHQSFITTEAFYTEHYDTVLRMASVIYRVLGQLNGTQAQKLAAIKAEQPWLATASGTKNTIPELNYIFGNVSLTKPFDQMSTFFTGSGITNVYVSGKQLLDKLYSTGVLRKQHTVSELDGAKQVWSDMERFKAMSDALFKKLGKATTPHQKALIAAAHKQYADYDYLDSVRLLMSASQA
jgi:hypothetical protein